MYARWHVGDEVDVVQRLDRVARTEEHRLARVQHRDVDAVGVHVGEPRLGVVAALALQADREIVELLRGHADGRGHLVLQLAAAAAHDAAGVDDVVALVLDDALRDPVAPPLRVHARGPQVLGLVDVPVGVDDRA